MLVDYLNKVLYMHTHSYSNASAKKFVEIYDLKIHIFKTEWIGWAATYEILINDCDFVQKVSLYCSQWELVTKVNT